MKDFIDKILKFFGDTFGNSTTGPRWGGILGLILGAGSGYLLGGVAGAGIGLIAGTVLGPVLNSLIDGITGGSSYKDKPPAGIDPKVQDKARETFDLSIDGKVFKIELPKLSELKRPWGAEGSDMFIHTMGEDTLRIVQNPQNKGQSIDLIQKTLKERNQPYYDYLATVYRYHQDFEKYNKETRPAIMRQLGLDPEKTSSAVFAPPEYREKLALEITNEKQIGLDTRVHLGISEETWNKLDPVTKLSRIEESMNKRMIEVSQKQAKLKAEMEEQDRKVPFDFDFSGNAFVNRLKGLTFGLFETADDKVEKAFKDFYEGKPEHQKKIGGQTYIIRDEKAAEDEFRDAMDEIITDYIAKGHRGGDISAKQYRELISLLIEERKVRIQWNGIKSTKQVWASQAERWTEDAEKFRTEITGYTARYANGAGANKNYAVIKEFTIPLMGTDDAKKRAAELQAEKKESLEQLQKASDGAKSLLENLDHKSLFALLPLDIEKDIKTMPTWDDVAGINKDKVPDDPVEKKYYDAAKRLETILGMKVKVSILRDDKGIPNFEIKAVTSGKAKELQDKLVAVRNAAGITKEMMPIGVEYSTVTINAASLMEIKETPVETTVIGFNNKPEKIMIKKFQPTGVKDDIFKKLEAKKTDFQAVTKNYAGDWHMRDLLEKAAVNYNAKIAAFKKDSNNTRAIAELQVAHKRMGEAIVDYLKTAVIISDASNKARDEALAELAKESGKGTELEGATGYRIFVVDKRNGKNRKIALDGIKKGDKFTVTGWSVMTPEDKMGEPHWFGKDMLDVAKGMEFDPKTFKGLDEIMKKVDAEPTSRPSPDVVTSVTPDIAPAADKKEVPVLAPKSVLDEALASVSFKPLADAAGTYVMPMAKDLLTRSMSAAA